MNLSYHFFPVPFILHLGKEKGFFESLLPLIAPCSGGTGIPQQECLEEVAGSSNKYAGEWRGFDHTDILQNSLICL
jgi:hypothetical protein